MQLRKVSQVGMIAENESYWFPFNPEKWVTLTRTLALSMTARGVLMDLICLQWLYGTIPEDRESLSKMLGFSGEPLEEALRLFLHKQGEPGRLYWPLIESWRSEVIQKRQRRSAAGKKGVQAKAEKKLQAENQKLGVKSMQNVVTPTQFQQCLSSTIQYNTKRKCEP